MIKNLKKTDVYHEIINCDGCGASIDSGIALSIKVENRGPFLYADNETSYPRYKWRQVCPTCYGRFIEYSLKVNGFKMGSPCKIISEVVIDG